jgi:hypothetical protein
VYHQLVRWEYLLVHPCQLLNNVYQHGEVLALQCMPWMLTCFQSSHLVLALRKLEIFLRGLMGYSKLMLQPIGEPI